MNRKVALWLAGAAIGCVLAILFLALNWGGAFMLTSLVIGPCACMAIVEREPPKTL